MSIRVTLKLFNKTTGSIELGAIKRKSAEKLKAPRQEKCPYLVNRSGKVCRRMTEEGLDGELSQFDVEHYCNGNPISCYFFRSGQSKKK